MRVLIVDDEQAIRDALVLQGCVDNDSLGGLGGFELRTVQRQANVTIFALHPEG